MLVLQIIEIKTLWCLLLCLIWLLLKLYLIKWLILSLHYLIKSVRISFNIYYCFKFIWLHLVYLLILYLVIKIGGVVLLLNLLWALKIFWNWWISMDSLQMSFHVTDLCKSFNAILTIVWSVPAMFSKMVSHVTRFLKGLITAIIQALEEVYVSLSQRISNFNHLMPFIWDSFKMLSWNAFMNHLA